MKSPITPPPAAKPLDHGKENLIQERDGHTVMVLYPYKDYGRWVFDDARTGLLREAFVSGADTVMSWLGRNFQHGGERGFRLIFGATPFPGHQVTLRRLHGADTMTDNLPVHMRGVTTVPATKPAAKPPVPATRSGPSSHALEAEELPEFARRAMRDLQDDVPGVPSDEEDAWGMVNGFATGHSFGNTYFCDQINGNAWLCPALFKYFTVAPENLFGAAEEIPGGIEPAPMPTAYRLLDPVRGIGSRVAAAVTNVGRKMKSKRRKFSLASVWDGD